MNKEKLQGYFEQVKTALGKISKKIWIIIGVTVAALAIGIVIFLNTRPYATLIAGATNEEAGAVLSWLQEQGITNYRMEGTGTILVPEGQAASLKARLLVDQYSQANATPTGYFEQVSALSTQADRNRAWLMELQSRMEQTICQFPEVRSATVNINVGEDRGYVLDSNNVVEASAGVILTMQRGKALTDAQANAIRNYVAYSVAGLKVESVSLEDTEGNDYSGQSTGVGTAAASSALKLQLERQIRADFEKQILQALTPIYGENNVSVAVTVEVELGDKTINDYKVTLPEFAEDGSTEGRGIPGKQFYTYQFLTPDEGAVGGLVGTPSNSELPTYVDPGDAQAELQSILEERHETEYDNSKTQTQMVITAGPLTKVTATVGIDAKDGTVRTAGWQEDAGLDCLAFAQSMEALGVKHFIFTDIDTDGTLSGPSWARLEAMQRTVSGSVTASGGVSSNEDLRRLGEMGLYGAIVGKAWYTGAVDLAQAIREGGPQ